MQQHSCDSLKTCLFWYHAAHNSSFQFSTNKKYVLIFMFAVESSIPKMDPNSMNQAIDMIPLSFILEAMLKKHSQKDISEYKVLALAIETVVSKVVHPPISSLELRNCAAALRILYYLSIDVFFQLTLP